MSSRNMTVLIGMAFLVFLASNALYVINEKERGVLLRFGEVVNPDIQPGLHWKIPFVNNVRKFDGRVLTVDSQAERFFTQDKTALIVDSYATFQTPPSSIPQPTVRKRAPRVCWPSASTTACVTRWPCAPCRK